MNTVINPDENQPTTQVTTQPAAAAVDVAALQAELAAAKGQLTEAQRNSEFWFNRASTPAPARAEEAAEEPEDETDVLDVLTTQGAKGLDSLLAKRGYVRAAEVDARVNAKASQIVQEQQLLTDYPDLKDQKSEFFLATAESYRDLTNQGVPAATAMRIAAQQAELHGYKSGKRQAPAANDREQQRLARIAAQSGETNNRAQEGSDADDELGEHEKYICRAMGISEDAYKARAQKGIQMGGLNRGGIQPQRGGDGKFKKA